jgi:hypothetical protein
VTHEDDGIKFTRGPWCYAGRLGFGHLISPNIAVAYVGDASGRAEHGEANARLIAAAPDMFEALSRWVDLAETAIRELGIEPHPDERKCLDLARGALAKARATPVSDTGGAGRPTAPKADVGGEA